MAKMNDRVKRRYNSPVRREKAMGTRRHIAKAAAIVFAQRGYGRTTMESIAEAAGVGAATVYANFGTKAAVVEAMMVEITGDQRLDVNLVLEQPDLDSAVRVGVGLVRQIHERSSPLTDLLRSSRGHEPALEALWQRWQERHLTAMRQVARWLASRHALRAGLSAEAAADILYVLMGAETYRELVQDRGWSPQRYQGWLVVAAQSLLVVPFGPRVERNG
jgi:AcrR family transcriptional regulator